MKIIDIVGRKGQENIAKFNCYKEGRLYYEVYVDGKPIYLFPINIEDKTDIGNAAFGVEYKAITLMRYIRKAIENETLIKYYK